MACQTCRLKKKTVKETSHHRKHTKKHGAKPKRIRTQKFTWRDLYGCGC